MFFLLFKSLFLFVTLAVALPAVVLFFECTIAAFFKEPEYHDIQLEETTSVVVIVPAHNEEQNLPQVLKEIRQHLRSQDRLLVIADNCTDETAAVSRRIGAEAIERRDEMKRGKGYALDFGLRALTDNPPDVVIIMDADCRVSSGSLMQLAAKVVETGRPSQAIYLFEIDDLPNSKATISALAISVKNWIRPLGLYKLGFPTPLFGTGMAFPWASLATVNVASSHIVEDMKLGFDLAIAGYPPLLCPEVIVESKLPTSDSAATSQRTRWEHGHLKVLREYIPVLIWQSLQQKRSDLMALALDLSIPPLSLLVTIYILSTVVAVLVGAFGLGQEAVIVSSISIGLILSAIGIVLLRFSHSQLSLRRLADVAVYIIWKIPLYLKFLVKPESKWIRTERTDEK